MEALAAVSLAGSILQFTDFTTSVVSKTKEFYITTSGSLKEYDDLHSITIHLKNLSDRLSCQDSTGYTDPLLDTISSRCSQAVEELLFALDTLAVEGQNTRLKSFRKALKCLWGKEKVLTFTRRVGGFRQDLMLHVTANLR